MNVLVGVTGGIAAYKSAHLVREFIKRDDEVRVVMTESAEEFIGSMTMQALSENPVGTDLFDAGYESEIGHIDLARWADVVVVAPATADFIARAAAGMADDLLTTVLLATRAPVVVAPAMNTQMWYHPSVTRNIETLRGEYGWRVLHPDSGELACREIGPGRMPDPPDLAEEVIVEATEPILDGGRVLITAGPTREPIDPARMLTNPSTGKMGYALAKVARRLGAEVTLISGPTMLEQPVGVDFVEVETAQQMHDAVFERVESMDVIIKSAAVCDWRPTSASEAKLKKDAMSGTLELERNPDILAELGQRASAESSDARPLLVGFAAESSDVAERGEEKRQAKGADILVANRIGGEDSTFGSDEIVAHVLTGTSKTQYGPISKEALAGHILEIVADRLER
jgi:phosphopantothenoylcysteine decarboxylase/phosphopantothenate--cysteine ligase